MFSVILSLIGGFLTGMFMSMGEVATPTWCIIWSVFAFLVIQFVIGYFIRKQVSSCTDLIQNIIKDGQEKLQRKVKMLQQKPQGGIKQMQKMLERDQRGFIEQALAATESLKPFFRWSPLLAKQVSTMRMQFYYQLKQFDKVDELMPKCFYMEPISACMRLARMYKNDDPAIDKFFRRKARRFKKDKGTLLYATYSWILVHQNNVDEARTLLSKGKEVTGDETLERNWEHLSNNRVKNFSNAAFGDEWYAIALEDPRVQIKRERQVTGKGKMRI